jgi:hypothetical protein
MSGSIVRVLQEQKLSEQHIQNFSFDHDFGLLIVELAGYDSTTDSIKRVAVNSLGKLLISIDPVSSVWQYNEVLTIAANALTTILTYTVSGSDLYIDNILASGTVDGEFSVLINGVVKAKYRTSEQDRTTKIVLPTAQRVAVGSIIDIKVVHYNIATADFDASIMGHN